MIKNLCLGAIAVLVAISLADSKANAQPGPNDVKVNWAPTFPKVVNGKLQVQGTVVFANGWKSADNIVTITIAPSAGGAVTTIPVALKKLAWSDLKIDVSPYKEVSYDIKSSVQATNNGKKVYVVMGSRVTISNSPRIASSASGKTTAVAE